MSDNRGRSRRQTGLPPLAVVALVLAGGVDAEPSRAAAPAPHDPLALYGPRIEFDVLRNGSPVGAHTVRIDRNGADLVVRHDLDLRVRVLFLTAYRFAYRSDARWRDGQLQHLTASVDDDGAVYAVRAVRHGDRLRIVSGDEIVTADGPLYPTNHWHAGVLTQERVLNTLTGRVNRVTITPQGREAVPTERGTVTATRYAYSGELQTEVWYDRAGRWVKMRFAGKDGSTIDYVCRRCQGPARGGAIQ